MRKKCAHSLSVAAVGILLLHQPALAGGVGDTKINKPSVERGELELENFGGFATSIPQTSGTAWKNSTELSYGVNDWLKVGAYGIFEKDPGAETRFAESEIISVIQFTDQKNSGIDTGVYLEYELNHLGGNNEVAASFLLGKDIGPIESILNIGFSTEVGGGRNDVVEGSIDAGFYYDIPQTEFEIGLEYFSDYEDIEKLGSFKEQNHRIGPVVEYEIPGTSLEMQIGYLAGLSEGASDNVFKYVIEYEF